MNDIDPIKTAERIRAIVQQKKTGWSLDRIDDEMADQVALALLDTKKKLDATIALANENMEVASKEFEERAVRADALAAEVERLKEDYDAAKTEAAHFEDDAKRLKTQRDALAGACMNLLEEGERNQAGFRDVELWFAVRDAARAALAQLEAEVPTLNERIDACTLKCPTCGEPCYHTGHNPLAHGDGTHEWWTEAKAEPYGKVVHDDSPTHLED